MVSAAQYTTLAGQIKEWWAQRNRRQLIEQAEQLASADVAALTADHARLEPEAQAAEAKAAAQSRGRIKSARVKELQSLASQRNILSILDDRLGAQQQLVALYVRWGSQVELQHKIMFHLMLQSLTMIATIVLLTILAGWALQVAFDRISRDRRQRQALRIILNLSTQVIGLVLVLLVIFGAPQQTPTILGLATAGLTVVFQDFILAFCGWFVLMGRTGSASATGLKLTELAEKWWHSGSSAPGCWKPELDSEWASDRTPGLVPERLCHSWEVLQLLHRRTVDVG